MTERFEDVRIEPALSLSGECLQVRYEEVVNENRPSHEDPQRADGEKTAETGFQFAP
jgi:hypothetical protein